MCALICSTSISFWYKQVGQKNNIPLRLQCNSSEVKVQYDLVEMNWPNPFNYKIPIAILYMNITPSIYLARKKTTNMVF